MSGLPPGITPEFLAEDNTVQVTVSTGVMLAISTILLGLRLYARALTNADHGWDEYFLLPSWLCLLAVSIVNFLAIPLAGVGRHVEYVVAEDPDKTKLANLAKLLYTLELFYSTTIFASRVSVLNLYLRVFRHRFLRTCCWATIAFLSLFLFSTLLVAQVQCIPLEKLWNPNLPGTCINEMLWYQMSNVPNIVADTVILILPLPTVWKLKTSNTRKAGLFAVFFTGSLGLVASSARLSQFYKVVTQIQTDPTWACSTLLLWTIIESGLYFMSACLIGLRPVLSRFTRFLESYGIPVDRTHGQTKHRHKSTLPFDNSELDEFGSVRNITRYGTQTGIHGNDTSYSDQSWQRQTPLQIRVDQFFSIDNVPQPARAVMAHECVCGKDEHPHVRQITDP